MLESVSHDCHVTIWHLKMVVAPKMDICWSKHEAESWSDVAVMACDANTCDKGLFYTLCMMLEMKFHAVIAAGLPQVCQKFAPSLCTNCKQ